MNKRHIEAIGMYLAGCTYAEMGEKLGVSRQRAQQLVRPPKAVYELVRDRAKGKCQKCHVKLANGHVHHKERVGMTADNFNEIDNLMYLCVACHQIEHADKRWREIWGS